MKPILFSTPMVQAILNGTKTQTRRTKGLEGVEAIEYNSILPNQWAVLRNGTAEIIKCPYGRAGEFLWVREQFAMIQKSYCYKASTIPGLFTDRNRGKWKPSIHMPFTACRLFLKIKSIRVERLQEITDEDAKAEGVEQIGEKYKSYVEPATPSKSAAISFASLWWAINGMDSWDANPFVWVIEFERTEKLNPCNATT